MPQNQPAANQAVADRLSPKLNILPCQSSGSRVNSSHEPLQPAKSLFHGWTRDTATTYLTTGALMDNRRNCKLHVVDLALLDVDNAFGH